MWTGIHSKNPKQILIGNRFGDNAGNLSRLCKIQSTADAPAISAIDDGYHRAATPKRTVNRRA